MKNRKNPDIIKIRLDIVEGDPLYKIFLTIKKRIALNANTEVVRYALKKTYDKEFLRKNILESPLEQGEGDEK